MLRFLLIIFLLPAAHLFAQDCKYESHNRKGGNFYFSYYYCDYSKKVQLEGVFEQRGGWNGGEKYYIVFQKGRIVAITEIAKNGDTLHQYNMKTGAQTDSIYGTGFVYSYENELEGGRYVPKKYKSQEYIFYFTPKGEKRKRENYYYSSGKLKERKHFVFNKCTDLKLHSCDDGFDYMPRQSGWNEKWYDSGVLEEKIWYDPSYDFGKPEGEATKYYPGGKIQSVTTYRQGNIAGPFISYYENGQIKEKGEYGGGWSLSKTGTWEGFYADGKKQYVYENSSQVFNNGIAWNEKGDTSYYSFFDSKGNGIIKRWHDNGQLSNKTIFKNKKSLGKSREWDETGTLTRIDCEKCTDTLEYRYAWYRNSPELLKVWDSIPHTMKTMFWNQEGIHWLTEWMDTSTRTKTKVEYYPSGKPKSRNHYKLTSPEGKQTTWYPNGQLKEEFTLTENKYNGEYKLYAYNGELLTSAFYKNNLRDGKFIQKDSSGNLLFEGNYRNGKSIRSKFFAEAKSKFCLPQPYANNVCDSIKKIHEMAAMNSLLLDLKYDSAYIKSESILIKTDKLNEMIKALHIAYNILPKNLKEYKRFSQQMEPPFLNVETGFRNYDHKESEARMKTLEKTFSSLQLKIISSKTEGSFYMITLAPPAGKYINTHALNKELKKEFSFGLNIDENYPQYVSIYCRAFNNYFFINYLGQSIIVYKDGSADVLKNITLVKSDYRRKYIPFN